MVGVRCEGGCEEGGRYKLFKELSIAAVEKDNFCYAFLIAGGIAAFFRFVYLWQHISHTDQDVSEHITHL